jgi:AAA domain-containing protein
MTTIESFPSDLFAVDTTKQIVERGFVAEEYIVKGVVPRTGFGILYGSSGSFKSFFAVHLGHYIAAGWRWVNRRVWKVPVVYICAEGAGGIEKRIRGFVSSHPDFPEDAKFCVVKGAPDLGSQKSVDYDQLIKTIHATCGNPGLIVIDTLAQCLGGADENGSGVTSFIRNAQNLARRFDCFVLAIHHVGWSADKRPRGHSSLNGAVDLQILTDRLPNELAATMRIEKVKDGESGFHITGPLRPLVIGTDSDGDEISTLVVDRIEDGLSTSAQKHAKGAARQTLPEGAKRSLAALKRVTKKHGAPPEGDGFPEGVTVVPFAVWREEAMAGEVSNSDNPDAKRMAFTRSCARLRKDGRVGVLNDHVWLAA